MKASAAFVFSILAGSRLFASIGLPQADQPGVPKRDLTLIANPSAFPPSPAEIARLKIRLLKAEHDAVVARIAAIEARIRKIRDDSEARIKALAEERDALAAREKEIGEALKTPRP